MRSTCGCVPQGAPGHWANSLEGFENYHAQSAWTWEHMALTRARVIHGPPDARRAAGRDHSSASPQRPRDLDALPRDVADMRDRIARHAPPKSPSDFKHLPGGLFDIDFVAQYLALRPPRPGRTSSIRIRPRSCAAPPMPACATVRDAERLRRCAAADVRCPEPAAAHPERRRGLVRRESKAPEGQQRLIASDPGCADLAALRARIEAEAKAARAIPERIGGNAVARRRLVIEERDMSVEEGMKAPDFTAATDGGGKLKLSELRGAPVVLYFYPKDDTPGCTTEACGFRDGAAAFKVR